MGNAKVNKIKKFLFKHETEADWLLSSYIPDKGELVVFDREVNKDGTIATLPEGRTEPYSYQRFKLGDGILNVNELPFATSTTNIDPEVLKELEEKISEEIKTSVNKAEEEIFETVNTQMKDYIKKVPTEQKSVLFWQPYPNGYSDIGEDYENITQVPTTKESMESPVYIYQNLQKEKAENANSLTIEEGNSGHYLSLIRNNPAIGSRFQFKCLRNKVEDKLVNEELCFSSNITIIPASDEEINVENRGIDFTGTAALGSDGKLYKSGFKITRASGANNYSLTIKSINETIELQQNTFTITIIYSGLEKGNQITCQIKTENGIIEKIGYLESAIVNLVGFDVFMGGTQTSSGNCGYKGEVHFDNTYFGPRSQVAEDFGEYKMLPVSQEPIEETLVIRDKNGSLLTKKELNETDDERSVTSKYYVDNLVKSSKGKPEIVYISSIDETYYEKEELPTTFEDGTRLLVSNEQKIYTYIAEDIEWVPSEALQDKTLYCVLGGEKAGVYKYVNQEPWLVSAERNDLENANKYTDEELSKIGEAISEISEKVAGLEASSVTAIIHSEKPEENISPYNFYTYTETIENIYAISTARKNHMVYNDYEVPINIEVKKDVSNPSEIKSPKSVFDYELDFGNLTNPIITGVNIYYLMQPNEAYVYVDGLIAAKLEISSGWHSPSSALGDGYGGVITSPLSAEWGKTYVVAEIKEKLHTVQYYNGVWQEISLNPNNDFVRRLGDISAERFNQANIPETDKQVAVHVYRALNNNYDRVYVEGKENSGVIADYCLTPSADEIPDNPWQDPDLPTSKLRSVPVRLEDGGISVYTDEKSDGSYAVSKDYLELFSERVVRKKPEESADVYNAGVPSVHTWTPDDNGYDNHAEKFDAETIPTNLITMTSTGASSGDDPAEYGNKVYVSEGSFVCEKGLKDKQITFQVAKQDGSYPVIFLFKIFLNPFEPSSLNRGITFTPYNNASGGNPIWSTKINFTIAPSTLNDGTYSFQMNKDNEDNASELAILNTGVWHTIRLELDGVEKGSARRFYLDNILKYSGTIASGIAGMKAYRAQILATSGGNSGYSGIIQFDDIYFGELPIEARYNGYDALTPVSYDYDEEAIKNLNKDSVVLRKPDGTILTKKEISEQDDDRIAVSKHYVDSSFVRMNNNSFYIIDGGCVGTDLEIIGDELQGQSLIIGNLNVSELVITDTGNGMIADII